jgi:tetratricopeptide (TPR) repeat protein
MFGLFSKRRKYSYLDERIRMVIDEQFLWLHSCFGKLTLDQKPFVFPQHADYSIAVSENLALECTEICKRCSVDVTKIMLCVFDNRGSNSWIKWKIVCEGDNEPLLERTQAEAADYYMVDIFQSTLKNPYWSILVLSHQISGIALQMHDFLQKEEQDFKVYNDAAMIYLGYGIFAMHCLGSPPPPEWKLTRDGLYFDKAVYASAILCLIRNVSYLEILPMLSSGTALHFRHEAELLEKFGETRVTKQEILRSMKIAEVADEYSRIESATDFDKKLELLLQIDSLHTNDYKIANNIGYILLQQKNYEQAIEWFDRSIASAPYYSFAFNNRGYCRIMLDQLEEAHTDIETAIELQRENSFAWRNQAICKIITGNFEEAIRLLDKAFVLLPQTELIYFYYSLAHLNNGNEQEAARYRTLSIELKEYNDSRFDFTTIFERQN